MSSLWKQYKTTVKQYLYNDDSDAKQWMNMMDMCFKLSLEEKEDDVIMFLCRSFIDLRDKARRRIKKNIDQINYWKENPIFPHNKDVNQIIIDLLYKDITSKETDGYKLKAKSIARSTSYLHRFYIPDKRNSGEYLEIKGHKYLYRELFDMFMIFWDE